MSSKEEVNNNLKQIKTIDSSELSSDTSDEELQIPTEVNRFSPILINDISFNEDFYPSYINNKKRSRFFSEDTESNFNNRKSKIRKTLKELKIKKIDQQLKNITKDEIINTKQRKFTFS